MDDNSSDSGDDCAPLVIADAHSWCPPKKELGVDTVQRYTHRPTETKVEFVSREWLDSQERERQDRFQRSEYQSIVPNYKVDHYWNQYFRLLEQLQRAAFVPLKTLPSYGGYTSMADLRSQIEAYTRCRIEAYLDPDVRYGTVERQEMAKKDLERVLHFGVNQLQQGNTIANSRLSVHAIQ